MSIVAREGVRADPLDLANGRQHRLNPVELPMCVVIKSYVCMNNSDNINEVVAHTLCT